MLDVLGVPGDGLVGGEQLVLDLGGARVPAGLGVVDERGAAAPAVRVGVLVLAVPKEPARLAQCLDDRGIRLANAHVGEGTGTVVEGAVRTDRVVDHQVVVGGQAEVVLAERRARVDHAGAVLDRYEVPGKHGVAARAVVADVGKGRLVAQTEKSRAGHALLDLRLLTQHPPGQDLGDDEALLTELRAHVGDLGVDGDRRVGHQGPGHRGPGQERDAGVVAQRKADVDARVDRVLVALRHLVRGERRSAARAVRDHLVALGEQALLPDGLERPPDGLDVVVAERVVGVARVDPEADPLGQLVPLVDVAQHRLPAARVELGDAVSLDIRLGGEAELLLDLELHRQAVAIPARLAGHEVAAHRAVAGKDVLEDPAEHVARVRAAVGGGRALVEDVRRRALAAPDGLAEHIPLTPALEHPLLELRERLGGIDGRVAGHGTVDSRRGVARLGSGSQLAADLGQ